MEASDGTVATKAIEPVDEGVGAMLRNRRLELGLSQADVAHVVKLPARRIEAMEQERWDELPDGPFLRGFLRNIARALNLDAAALVARVDASLLRSRSPDSILVPQGGTHVALPRRSGPADERRGGRALVVGAFAFALIAAVIAWSGTDSFDRVVAAVTAMVDPSRTAASDALVAPQKGAESPARAAAAPAIVADPVLPESRPAEPSAVSSGTAAANAPALALVFHFNEESWVEVRSADGKVLLQRLNAAGSEQQVEGEAPFSLVVGNAKGVALRFRGQAVDLAPYTRDSVARFTLS